MADTIGDRIDTYRAALAAREVAVAAAAPGNARVAAADAALASAGAALAAGIAKVGSPAWKQDPAGIAVYYPDPTGPGGIREIRPRAWTVKIP